MTTIPLTHEMRHLVMKRSSLHQKGRWPWQFHLSNPSSLLVVLCFFLLVDVSIESLSHLTIVDPYDSCPKKKIYIILLKNNGVKYDNFPLPLEHKKENTRKAWPSTKSSSNNSYFVPISGMLSLDEHIALMPSRCSTNPWKCWFSISTMRHRGICFPFSSASLH